MRCGGRDEPDQLRALGPADQADEKVKPVGIWPENLLTCGVFFDQEYQWREKMTADGPEPQGLDHGQIKHTLELMRVKKRKWPEIFNGLKVMESEAIKVMRGEE